jgi:putative membrane protein
MADEDYAIPIFLINGQLESGKTTFISDTIEMGQFDEAQKKLLIVCEEGEEEYDEKLLRENAVDMVVLDRDEFTPEKLEQLDRQYDPWVVIVEYNGMWDPKLIEEIAKPRGWEIYQTITMMDAGSFQLQWQNMKSIMAESVKRADMVIFNRCVKGMNLGSFRRSMRALNGNLQVVFEDENGDQVAISEQLPYDISQDVIEVDDDDYGIWYMDVNDRPEVYKDKTVCVKGQVLKNRQFKKKNFVPGRKVMTCCAADMQFIGYIAEYDKVDELTNKEWVKVTAKITYAFRTEYRKKGPVLQCIRVEKAEPPANEIVSF